MRSPHFILVTLLLTIAMRTHTADDSLTELRVHYDSSVEQRLELERLEGNARIAELKHMAAAIAYTTRLNAILLANATSPQEAEILTALLDDPSGFLRREAARKLFGADSSKLELAKKYNYQQVLENQKQCEEILKSLPTLPIQEQYATTRKLERIGLDATVQLRNALQSDNRIVVLSAMSVFDTNVGNVEPRWLAETRAKLEKPISVEFKDVPLQKSVHFISEITGARISIQKDGAGETTVSLRVNEMKAAMALEWLARLADLEVSYRAGEVQLHPLANLGIFVRAVWVHDARDLLNSNDKPAAEEIIARIGKAYQYSVFGTKIEILDGFIVGTDLENVLIQDSITKELNALRAKK